MKVNPKLPFPISWLVAHRTLTSPERPDAEKAYVLRQQAENEYTVRQRFLKRKLNPPNNNGPAKNPSSN